MRRVVLAVAALGCAAFSRSDKLPFEMRSSSFPGSLGAFFLLFAAVSLTGCQGEEKERPPILGGCSDCGGTPGTSGGSSGGGNEGGTGGVAEGTLTGNVLEYVDTLFDATKPSEADATVYAFSTTSGTAQGELAVDGAYTLDDVAVSIEGFVAAVPSDDEEYVTTLFTADTTDGREDVVLTQRVYLDDLYAPTSLNPNPDRGTVVLRLRNSVGDGVPDVSVTASDAERVLFRDINVYSESRTTTTNDGVAVLLNVEASAFPGGFVPLALGGAVTRTLTVRVARDAVTILDIVL